MRTISVSRKGFIGDLLTIAVMLFVLGITILVTYKFLSATNESLSNSQLGMSTEGQQILSDYTTTYPVVWDNFFGLIFIGLCLALLISAAFIDTVPLFFAFLVIVLAIYTLVGGMLSNAYYAVEATPAFSGYAETFIKMHYILNNLPYYIVVEGFALVIVLLAKWRTSSL